MNQTRTVTYTLLLIITLLLTQAATVTAQSGPQFALSAGTVSSGGGIQGGGIYRLAASVGQPGGTVSGGSYSLVLGLLAGGGDPEPRHIYLPLVSR